MSLRKVDVVCTAPGGCGKSHTVEVEVTDPPPREIIQVKEDTAKLDALTAELNKVKDNAAAAGEELEAWQSMSKHRPVGEILQHLADCPNCRPELDIFLGKVRTKALSEATPEQAKEIAKLHKLWPPPSIDFGSSRRARE
jgi:hypothetical protein